MQTEDTSILSDSENTEWIQDATLTRSKNLKNQKHNYFFNKLPYPYWYLSFVLWKDRKAADLD